MKKLTVALSAVAVTVMMAGMADAAEVYNKDGNKLDLYGKVDGLHYFSKDKGDDGDQSYVRLGFKGETQINDQLTGYGQWEYNIQANHDEDNGTKGNATRLAFAGLKFTDFGSIDYGRNNGVIYDIGAWTDVLPEFGNDTYEDADRFMTGRANGLLTYHNTDFFGLVDGLNFSLQYQGKNGGDGESNNGKDREAKSQNGDGYGMSVTWEGDAGFGLGAAYSNSRRTKDQRSNEYSSDGKRAEVWTGGLKYDANNIYLAATYAQTRNMQWADIAQDSRIGTDLALNKDAGAFLTKTENYEIVAQYMLDFGLQPSIAYLQSKAKDVGKYGDIDLVKYVDVGATYNFNKNMSAYIDYKINLLKDNNPAGLSTSNLVATGLVYEF
ncbi:TPA: porin OmpC [Salmonella enterica subsp. enterica serovar Muenchen]|uniref:Porin OmpC n=1 Tax=Salmonella enterica TaxID=28901 RepID=A0A759HER7_SALER|nr:porin OmpC [Salmonella enterica]EBS3610266.1 phosphoporin PhoE [Salmonella enterica subsp. enterica serovar Poona]EDM1741599.1 phosphoporin PhoE [Salmonella enterica subsp. enterica serovar Muenchen]EDV5543549.1 porin OmpC [Salmonella enterica subsp. enterica]EGB1030913.1 porin OmpC [Salmonella enterica subsp. enterica serovar Reading]EGI5702422.1 porin OmpC [Salmonella enterica subsp. enterica serovar Chester]HEC8685160.1 porin OmpC [Salmonella enterica subsp. enterica serovar Oranienburg